MIFVIFFSKGTVSKTWMLSCNNNTFSLFSLSSRFLRNSSCTCSCPRDKAFSSWVFEWSWWWFCSIFFSILGTSNIKSSSCLVDANIALPTPLRPAKYYFLYISASYILLVINDIQYQKPNYLNKFHCLYCLNQVCYNQKPKNLHLRRMTILLVFVQLQWLIIFYYHLFISIYAFTLIGYQICAEIILLCSRQYSPVKNGASENHAVGYTMSVIWRSLVNSIAGWWNNMSKHIKVPKFTPKSVLKITTSGTEVTLNCGSKNRFVLRYLSVTISFNQSSYSQIYR